MLLPLSQRRERADGERALADAAIERAKAVLSQAPTPRESPSPTGVPSPQGDTGAFPYNP